LHRSEMVNRLQSLVPHDHAVLFYSDIDHKRELVFPFLQQALENHGAAAYLSSHESLGEVRDAMRYWGIEVDKHESSRCPEVCGYEDFMTAEGGLDAAKINQFLADLSKHKGSVRLASDPTALAKRGLADEIVRIERLLRRRLRLPLTMVCPYEETVADLKSGEFLIKMMRTHIQVVFLNLALTLA